MVKDTNREWMLEAPTEERVERGLPEKLPEPEKATEGRQSASLNNPS